MKSRLALILIVASLTGVLSWGGAVTLLSGSPNNQGGTAYATYGGNTYSSLTVLNDSNWIWATDPNGANWVSFMDTGENMPRANWLPDATDPNNPTAVFYQPFTVSTAGLSGVLVNMMVWADDTAAVYLDNSSGQRLATLYAPNLTVGSNCGDYLVTISCISGGGKQINSTYNFSGLGDTATFDLEFDVYQLGLNVFGLLYDGSATPVDDPVPSPEPSTYVLMAGGLIAMGLIGRTKYFAKRN